MTNPYPPKRFDTALISVADLVAALQTMPQDLYVAFESVKFRRQWEGALVIGLGDGDGDMVVVKLLPISDFPKEEVDEPPFLPTEADIRAYERNADR